MKIKEIAEILGCEIKGNDELEISGIAKIESAGKNQITFISNPLYEKFFYSTKAGAILISKDFQITNERDDISILRVNDPYMSFVKLLGVFGEKESRKTGISKYSVIPENAKIGKDIFIDDFVTIKDNCEIGDNVEIHSNTSIGENVKIGNDCILENNVTIYKDTIIGNNVRIHSGTVIGSDGFGYAKNDDGTFKKIPQLGYVRIEDNVEIGSCCSIDRATIGETLICKGVKIDNQVQIAHNVTIGEDSIIVAQVGIAGSTKVGKRCTIAGQSGLVGHLTICDDVIIGASVGVSKSITEPGTYLGYRAKPMRESLKEDINIKSIQTLKEKIKSLEEIIKKTNKE